MPRLLAVTAVPAERAALLADLPAGRTRRVLTYELNDTLTRAGALTCVAAGVGPAAAAACAATLLAADGPYDAVISAGVAGGFTGRATPGQLVVADRVVFADLGAGSPDGLLTLDDIGMGTVTFTPRPALVRLAAHRVGTVAQTAVGGVLTVSTATGTDERAAALAERFDPTAEAMEGGGVCVAAAAHRVPFLELRAVSNAVGRRDRSAWSLPEALAVLGKAVAALLDEPGIP